MENVAPLPVAGSDAACVDVVVAGAGPTGLFMGCLLQQAGVRVVLVDPHLATGQASKAAVTMPRSLEVMEKVGVSEELLSLGRRVQQARMSLGQIWDVEILGFSKPLDAAAYSKYYPLTAGQNHVEAILYRRFQELGGCILRAARFKTYRETASGVEVDIERFVYVRPPAQAPPLPAYLSEVQETTLQAKFLVGCDGKQSAVRTAMGAEFRGKEYPQRFFLADAIIEEAEAEKFNMHQHQMNIILNAQAASVVLLVRLQETLWRTYFCTKDLDPELCSEEFIRWQWKANFPPPGPPEKVILQDIACFSVSCRLVDSYSKGRCFLAGDAAHCHSPAGGQGMNTGLQDAANLAWKLAAVLSGQATLTLLESYEKERRPVAEWVLGTSDALFATITEQKSPMFNLIRKRIMKLVTSILPADALPPAFLKSKMFGTSLSYVAAGTCRNSGDRNRSHGSLSAGERLPYLLCIDTAGSKMSTADLLNDALPTAYLVILVGRTAPLQDELDKICLEMQSLKVPLKISTVTCPAKPCFLCLPLLSSQAPSIQYQNLGDEVINLRPVDSSTDLADMLKLPSTGKAMLAVRPDGYIAAIHRGGWDAQATCVSLAETGVSMSRQ